MSPRRLSVWPPLAPTAWLRPPLAELPFPLEEERTRLYAFARQGVWHGLPSIGLGEGDGILVPAWHHGSEVEAIVRRGLMPTFFDGAMPEEGALDDLVDERTKALYLIHPLGFPATPDRWRRWCDERGLLLVEDAAQAFLATHEGRPVGSWGDLAVFCLYKTIGVPEGAAVIARAEVPEPRPNPERGVGDHGRRLAGWAAQRSAAVTRLAGMVRPEADVPYDHERDIALRDTDSAPWAGTDALVRRLADPGVAARRRGAYRQLLDRLGHRVPAPFGDLPRGASPFAFPIESDDKGAELAHLAEGGVKALDLWSRPHPSLPEGFPVAERLRSSVIGLPVHQDLRRRDLDAIADLCGAGPAASSTAAWRLEPIGDGEAVLDEWRALAEASGNVFATPEVLRLWWRHARPGEPLELTGCRAADGSLAAVLPLAASRVGPLRVLRFLGHGVGDELGPIHRPGDELLAGDALRRHLAARRDWDAFVAEHVRGDVGWPALLDGTPVRRGSSPVLRIDGRTWDELLAERSSNFRQQVRRHARNLRKRHEVDVRLTTDAATLDADLDVLFRLHAARWGEASTFPGPWEAFHRELGRVALERGWLRLWTMTVDGSPAASWLGYRFAGDEHYYQAGRDPGLDDERVGFVLLCHTIEAAVGDGAGAYRFLRGDEPYKRRFTEDDPGLDSFVVGRGPAGQAGALGVAAALSVKARLR